MTGTGSDAGRPRYVEISQELWRRIESGEYPVGADIPTENVLMEEFGVSRFTVREALRILSEAGVLARRQGSGSRVISNRRMSRFTFSASSFSDVLRYIAPSTIRYKAQSRPLSKQLIETLNITDPADWSWFTGVRVTTEGERIALADMVVRSEYASVIGTETLPVGTTVYERINAKFGVELATIRQAVEATMISPAQARRLQCGPNVPGLKVIREFSAADRTFEYTVAVHPVDRFRFVISLHPDNTA